MQSVRTVAALLTEIFNPLKHTAMKKIYLLLTVALAAALAPTAGRAQGGDVLVPEQSVMGMNALPHRVHYPIRNAGFSFEAPVTVSEGATLYIMRGDEVLAESPLV